MNQLRKYGVMLARILMSVVFLLNATGIIDQSVPAREAIERGIPAALVPAMMVVGRTVELIGGLALMFGFYPQFAALALLAFLIPATFVSHSFWLAAGSPAYMGQLINFSKNLAIWGGLLFIGSTEHERTN